MNVKKIHFKIITNVYKHVHYYINNKNVLHSVMITFIKIIRYANVLIVRNVL